MEKKSVGEAQMWAKRHDSQVKFGYRDSGNPRSKLELRRLQA
jgi:hypothetical protein